MTESEEKWLRAAKARLNEGADQLDAATRAALTERRREVLERSDSRGWFAVPVPALGAAAVLVLGISLWLYQADGNGLEPMLDDIELLASSAEVADYQELDFYLWLDEEQAHEG